MAAADITVSKVRLMDEDGEVIIVLIIILVYSGGCG